MLPIPFSLAGILRAVELYQTPLSQTASSALKASVSVSAVVLSLITGSAKSDTCDLYVIALRIRFGKVF